jgi:hypothetical protein
MPSSLTRFFSWEGFSLSMEFAWPGSATPLAAAPVSVDVEMGGPDGSAGDNVVGTDAGGVNEPDEVCNTVASTFFTVFVVGAFSFGGPLD